MAKRSADGLTGVFENVGEGSQAPPPRKRTTRHRGPPTPQPPLYHASVKEVADAGAGAVGSSAADDIDNALIQRIKKCLARAHHPGTPEAEAKAALHLASRMMGQYNVSQAEVLAHEPPSAQQQYAGQSVVSLRRMDGDASKQVRHQGYVDDLCHGMTLFFDCKYYTTTFLSTLEVTFYGIGENTTAAAMSFEMVYNLVNEWARAYKGGNPRNSYLLGVSLSLASMAKKEKAAEGDRARRAEAEAIATKEREEQAERQAQLDRLAPLRESPIVHPKSEPNANADMESVTDDSYSASPLSDQASNLSDSESDKGIDFDDDPISLDEGADSEDFMEPDFKVEDGDRVNPFASLDDEVQRLIKVEPETSGDSSRLWSAPLAGPRTQIKIVSPERSPTGTRVAETERTSIMAEERAPDEEPQWASHMQLVTFRATAAKIADDFLRDKGVKLRMMSVKGVNIGDKNAYRQGKEDSKKIDVRRRRITE